MAWLIAPTSASARPRRPVGADVRITAAASISVRLVRDCAPCCAQNVTVTSLFAWLEGTPVAATVRDSLMLTGSLSAVHLIGFTLTTGGALVANLNLLGVLFPERPAIEVTRPASRGMALGLAISALTGALLFAPRATAASVNWIFQLKMALLATAALFHLIIHRRVARNDAASASARRTTAAAGLLLWTSLALAGCAFILLE